MPNSQKITIKQILLSNNNWWHFHEKYKARLRPAITVCITKLLSCKNIIRGYLEYRCTNTSCSHIKYVAHTCKCKACSSCGKKATELWIQKQNQILPNTDWQHITLTMPCELWDFFWYNRYLLNQIAKIAANCLQKLAKQKKIILGIFIAIHTFGRDLKRNVHLHISTTAGGLSEDLQHWKKISFYRTSLMKMWRYAITQLFRQCYQNNQLVIPVSIQKILQPIYSFNNFLNDIYQKDWIIDCQKPTHNYKKIIQYLGRYFKRPPIAESKLRHYDGQEVTLSYLDHISCTYQKLALTAEEFIRRFIQHIPDIGFRMIRYYGFLSNKLRSKLLPRVYQVLGQQGRSLLRPPSWVELIQKNFGFNPLTCILCGSPMVLYKSHLGLRIDVLLSHHRKLALLLKI